MWQGGGILSANLFDFASGPGARGNWVNYAFVAGVQHVFAPTDNTDIGDPSHTVISDGLPCPSGNCAPIVDGPESQDDLDGWFVDALGSFTNLPEGTTVIIQDEATGAPVMVEYPFGAGTVIASLTATEWMYTGGGLFPPNKKLLANEIAFQDCLANHLTGHDGQCLCRPDGAVL